jgi:hypothetical protein
MNRNYIIILLILLLILAGCGGGISTYGAIDYNSLIKSGWEKYNQNLFQDSYDLFCQARNFDSERPEAYIGCGWSLFMRQHPDSALVEFYHGFDYITTLADSVDTICGIAGSYLARNENNRTINFLNAFDLNYFENSFPLKNHDFFLEKSDLELVLAQAYYRLKIYSSTEAPDPNNALYHLNQVLFTPYEYTTPDDLMEKITEYLYHSEGDLF